MQAYIILSSKVFLAFSLMLLISGFVSVIFIDALMDDFFNKRKVSFFKRIVLVPVSIGFSLGLTIDRIFNISGDYDEEEKQNEE